MHILDVLDPIVSVMITAFVNGLWQGLILLGLIWCLLRALEARRGLNATTRYAVWSITLLALVVLPVGAGLIAAMQSSSTDLPLSAESPTMLPDLVAEPVLEESPRAVFITGKPPVIDAPVASFSGEPLVGLAEPLEEVAVVEPMLHPSRWYLTLPPSMRGWTSFLFAAWLLVALFLLTRVAWGYVYLRRLKRQSTPLPLPYQQRLEAWRRAYGLHRPARIARSEVLASPVAAGLSDPMILFPAALLDHLTEEEFDQVALHEWAHLQRWDDWTNLLQRFAEALLFFHPAVLWVGRQMDREREMACDDWVVWRTHRPRSYATCLTRLVELNVHSRALLVAPGMAASKERLFERVKRLLDQGRHVTANLSKTGLLTMVLAVVAAVLLMARLAPIFALTESSEEPELLSVEPELDSATRFEPSRPDTILTYQTLQVSLGRLQQSSGRLQESQGRIVQSVGKLQPIQQVLQVSTLRLRQSTATLNRIQPTLRRISGQRQDLSKASWIRVLKSAARISSSGDKARFLVEAAHRLVQDEAVYAAYIETVHTIGSSGDRTRALSALLANHRLGKSALLLFLDAVKGTSGGDMARLLIRVADVLPDDDEVRAAYVDVAETIASPGDYRRAMKAMK